MIAKIRGRKEWEIDEGFVVSILLCVIVLFCLNLVLHLRYFEGDRVLYLDELTGYIENYANSEKTIFEKLFGSEVIRPIPHFITYLLFCCCGNNYNLFNWVLLGNHFLLSVLVFGFAYDIQDRRNGRYFRVLISLGCGIMYLFSRFMQCQIFSNLGIMEGTAHFASLMCVLMLIRDLRRPDSRSYVLAIVWWLIALYSHERFLGLLIPILAAAFLVREKVMRLIVPVMILVLYWIQRIFILNDAFRGTSGTSISSTFSIKGFMINCLKQAAYLLGFNAGPAVRNGICYKDVPVVINIFIVIFDIGLFFILFFFVKSIFKASADKRCRLIKECLLIVSAIGSCILCSGTTIDIAVRFVYVPYSLMLVLIADMFSFICAENRLLYKRIVYAVCFCSMILFSSLYEVYYRSQIVNVGFYKYKVFTESLYEITVQRYGRMLEHMDLLIVGNYLNWSMEDYERFFIPYIQTDHMDIKIYSTMEELQYTDAEFENAVVILADAESRKCIEINLACLERV